MIYTIIQETKDKETKISTKRCEFTSFLTPSSIQRHLKLNSDTAIRIYLIILISISIFGLIIMFL